MIYKTLHWYVLRELLRLFLMTAAALTTLMAFGGTFKPLSKEGVDVMELTKIMFNLMPAMLAYAIPIAALFAAVLVYWRLSTDNELTACRASGISFWSILLPALVLGVVVASVDLVFVNFVVPSFLQKTEKLIRRDAAQLMVSSITKQDAYRDPNGRMVVYANTAEEIPTGDPLVQEVKLGGVVAVKLRADKTPQMIGTALWAIVRFEQDVKEDVTYVTFRLTEAAAYDPQRFTSMTKDFVDMASNPQRIPSQLKDKPKFFSLFQLKNLNTKPYKYDPLQDQLVKFNHLLRQQQVSRDMHLYFEKEKKIWFRDGDDNKLVVTAPDEQLSKDSTLVLAGKGGAPVRVTVTDRNGREFRRYETMAADISLDSDETSPVRAIVNLRGKVTKAELIGNAWTSPIILTGFTDAAETVGASGPKEFVESLPSLQLPDDKDPASRKLLIEVPPGVAKMEEKEYKEALGNARQKIQEFKNAGGKPDRVTLAALASEDLVKELDHTISSELHSRGSFAVSCLTLVMFGAALGVMLKGRNPLAVFVMGFLPSVLLVLLITMGRRVMESANGNQTLGLCLLWAGNAVLLVLVIGAYRKLAKT